MPNTTPPPGLNGPAAGQARNRHDFGDQSPTTPKPRRRPSIAASAWLAAPVIFFVIVVSLGYLLIPSCLPTNQNSDPPTTIATDEILGWSKMEARNSCHSEVLKKIDSPSNADFEGRVDFNAFRGDQYWTISGHVEAPNKAGTVIRNEYICRVQPDTDTKVHVSVVLFPN